MSRWVVTHPYFSPSQLEEKAAVYALYDARDGLVYIGETSNLQSRFKQHNFILARYSLNYHGSQFDIVDLKIKAKYSTKCGEEAMIEKRLIRRLLPKLNQRGLVKLRKLACG